MPDPPTSRNRAFVSRIKAVPQIYCVHVSWGGEEGGGRGRDVHAMWLIMSGDRQAHVSIKPYLLGVTSQLCAEPGSGNLSEAGITQMRCCCSVEARCVFIWEVQGGLFTDCDSQ